MGIYDREYYRREGPSFLGSFAGRGKACKWIIALNIALYVVQLASPTVTSWLDLRVGQSAAAKQELLREVDRDPDLSQRERAATRAQVERQFGPGVLQGQVWRLLTYSFLHAGIWHIVFNMLFLWWFGHEMEEMYGAREFTAFYLVSAVLGGIAYTAWAWSRGMPVPCVGASGAVTAVMVLFAFHYPTRVIYLFFMLPIPIWLFVVFEVASDTLIFTANIPTSTAVAVHLAGAAFGFAYYKANWRLAPLWQAVAGLRLPRRRPRVRIFEEEREAPGARRPQPAPTPPADEHLEAEVDAVLEKVARSGRDSLTEHEKALLVRASEVYKRRQRL